MSQSESLKKIHVYGDYGCGLWIEGACTDLDDDRLPFVASPELRSRFDAWVEDYNRLMTKEDMDENEWPLNEQEGREIAREIKRLAGPDIDVIYGPSWESEHDFRSMPDEVMV